MEPFALDLFTAITKCSKVKLIVKKTLLLTLLKGFGF